MPRLHGQSGWHHVREAQQGLGPAPGGFSPLQELPPRLLKVTWSVEYFTCTGCPSAREEKPHGLCLLGVDGLSEETQANEKCCQQARSLPWCQSRFQEPWALGQAFLCFIF